MDNLNLKVKTGFSEKQTTLSMVSCSLFSINQSSSLILVCISLTGVFKGCFYTVWNEVLILFLSKWLSFLRFIEECVPCFH